jgi:kynurenine formamidase
VPDWPSRGGHGVSVRRLQSHATDGLYTAQWEGIMHRGTHMDAPLHVLANQPSIVDYPLWRLFGTGVVVSIPKGKWEVIAPADLEAARPAIREHDIVIVNTGSHANWGDSEDYFGYSPGLYKEAAEWLVARNVKLVGVDVQALDHPLGTKLVAHGPGPTLPHLMDEYRAETGRDVMADFPHWEPAHKILMTNGIPGVENVGGEIDAITGQRCTFMIFPWRWPGGDGSGVRVVAVVDPDQSFRIERGEA